MIQITCGGARGSAHISHPDFLGFGGDTTSFQIDSASGHRMLVDAGSGIRTLLPGLRGRSTEPLHLALTHLHLDHLSGLARLASISGPARPLHIHAPDHLACTAREAIGRLFAPPYWPVDLLDAAFGLVFHAFTADGSTPALEHGDLVMRACVSHHPGGSTAVRIEDRRSGASAVLATDLEWSATPAAGRDALIALCALPHPAGVLIMDGQYDPDDYPAKAGWGHSTWREAAEVARHAGVHRLYITHHDESRDDTRLRAMEARLQRESPGARMIRQGDILRVPGP